MLNKKTLAVAIAASISTGAFAAQDISDKDETSVVVASELQSSTGKTTVVNDSSTLDVISDVGFGFAEDTTRYIRFDLTNAEFETAVTATELALSAGTLDATLLDGGTNGDTTIIFEVSSSSGAIGATDEFTLAAADFTLINAEAATVTYSIFETLTNAASNTSALKTFTGPLTQFGTAVEKSPIAADNTTLKPTATVSSQFAKFDNTEEVKAIIGRVSDAGVIKTGVIATDGQQVEFADVYNAAGRTATVTGDFSYVDSAYLSTSSTCAPSAVALTINDEETSATSASAAVDMTTDPYVCLEVDGETEIVKSSYSLSLARTATDVLTGELADVVYDTLSVDVPYLTTFEGYNQRLFIVNTSSIPANYSFSFTSEDGVTAVDGDAAEGTVPARSMVAIKATDIVTLTGRTRTSAVLELEADDANIKVTSQTVNLSDATTDTVVLN